VEFPAFPPLVLRCSSGLSPARRAASRLAVVLAEEHPAIGTENHNITGWDAAPIGEASTCNLKWAGGIPWVGCPRCGESCWSLWKLGALTTTKSSTSSYFAARSLPWPSAWLPDPCAAARQSAHRICSWRPGFVCAFPASVWQFRSDTSPRVFLRGALPATRTLGCHCRRLAVPASSPCRPLEQRRSSGGKTWNSAFPFHAMPRGACGLWRRSDTQSSAHRSWGDTQDPCGLGGLEIPAKTAARGQRACHIPMRNPLRIGPGRRKILLLADLPFQVGEVLTWHATWRHAILCASALGTRKIAGRPPEGPRPFSSCSPAAPRRKMRPTLVFPPLVLRCSSGRVRIWSKL